MNRTDLFTAIRPFAPDSRFSAGHVAAIDALADSFGLARADAVPAGPPATDLTVRCVLEIAGHESIVPEAYKDSGGVWTWGMGVTNASGHTVFPRYKDAPQTLLHCVEVAVWLMRQTYLPAVLKAFAGMPLTEAELTAALSYHWNTGAILTAAWVPAVKSGNLATARRSFTLEHTGSSTMERRGKERDLFFDGKWTNDGMTTVYDVAKPSYSPKWSSARRVDISEVVAQALKGGAA